MNTLTRNSRNPIVTIQDIPEDPRFSVIGVFNPAATVYKNETLLLLRVAKLPKDHPVDEVWAPILDTDTGDYDFHKVKRTSVDDSDPRTFLDDGRLYLTSISEFYLAHIDEVGKIRVNPEPFMKPEDHFETYGIEDPRITLIDDVYYITYSAVSEHGIAVRLARTRDWESVERLDIILPPSNKDCVLFPERIGGRYHMLHRPSVKGVPQPEIWYASSPDLQSWGEHRQLMSPQEDWEAGRIGGGAPPIRTDEGWLHFYHGADEKATYSLGAVLFDLDEPDRILWRTREPLMKPESPYELNGFFSGVVFVTGLVQRDETLELYYGASDSTTCSVTLNLDSILQQARTTLLKEDQ